MAAWITFRSARLRNRLAFVTTLFLSFDPASGVAAQVTPSILTTPSAWCYAGLSAHLPTGKTAERVWILNFTPTGAIVRHYYTPEEGLRGGYGDQTGRWSLFQIAPAEQGLAIEHMREKDDRPRLYNVKLDDITGHLIMKLFGDGNGENVIYEAVPCDGDNPPSHSALPPYHRYTPN